MEDFPTRGLLSAGPAAGATADGTRVRDLASRFEMLLEQAEGFVRGGDYLGAQACARYAHEKRARSTASARVADVDIVEVRRHLDLRLRHYDRLARDWQHENAARHTAHLVREREASGASVAQTREACATQTKIPTMFRRFWTSAFRCWHEQH